MHCGIAKHLSYWLPELRRPAVICAEHPPYWHSSVVSDWNTFPTERCWRRGAADALQSACAFAEAQDARIIHLQWDPSFFPLSAMLGYSEWAATRNVRTVVTAHTLMDDDQFVWENKQILCLADQFVVGTPAMVKAFTDYATRFGIRLRRPIRWIPLSAPHVAQPPPVAADPLSGPIILTWGFLGGFKGHAEVLDAVRLIRSFAPGARYVVVGRAMTGEQRNNMESLRQQSERDPGLLEVREGFLGDDEIIALCQSADCIVLNHQVRHISSSGTVVVSVASGTPVVVNDSPMFSGYIESGAVRVAAPGPAGIADAILDVLSDGHSLIAGRSEMIARTTPEAVAAQYEQVYSELEST